MKPTGNKVSVSLPGDMNAAAEQRRQSLGYRSFSAYVQHLIDEDLQRGGNHIRTPLALAEPAPPYRVPAPPAEAMPALAQARAAAQAALTKTSPGAVTPRKP